MEKCEENILYEIISKFKKGGLYDSNNNKIENTIQALKFAISIIQEKCKKQTSCAKGREPKITEKGYECGKDMVIQKNRKGENCCYKDKRKTKKKILRKSTTGYSVSSKKSKKSKKSDKDLQETHIFSTNYNLKYIENIILNTKTTKTLGFLGRTIDVINLKDINQNIENFESDLSEENIDKWKYDFKNIKIYDTVTLNHEQGKGQYLVYYNHNQLCLLKFLSEDGLIYPIESIECIERKIEYYKEIYEYDQEYALIKALDFFLHGDIRKDYNFFLPILPSFLDNIKDRNIKIENYLVNKSEYNFQGLFLIDTKNSNLQNKTEIIIIDISSLKEYIPKKITNNINNENFTEIKNNLNIEII
tara:strand:- start:809 stop:1891 length:1083 start_codon:yes stop_codon:yes gene_type:complete